MLLAFSTARLKGKTLCGVLNEEIEVLWAAKLTQQNQESPATM
jgi:hypothetical protein